MKLTVLAAALIGAATLASAAQAETGIWHRFKAYDVGQPVRPIVWPWH